VDKSLSFFGWVLIICFILIIIFGWDGFWGIVDEVWDRSAEVVFDGIARSKNDI